MTDCEIIQIKNLTKAYNKRDNPALCNVSFTVRSGDIISVMGSSGSGKSTLLNIIGTLLTPTSGNVYYFSTISLLDMSPNERAKFRRNFIGYVEQNFQLLDILNAYENIILPLKLNAIRADKAYIEGIISQLHLEECVGRFPNELSGGEQQRVAIARAIVTKPSILIADEPTANLDNKNKTEVMGMLFEINRTLDQTIIFSTHDRFCAETAKRTLVLSDGKLISDHVCVKVKK